MSFPFAQQPAGASTNPIENIVTSLNSNPYFIGSMMLLLNLGGRHLATGLTPEQDKFFQSPWFRRTLLFVVFFVATRNIIASFFMTFIFVIIIGFLFNDESTLFIFKPNLKVEKKKEEKQLPNGLTPEELEIHKRLTDKIQRTTKVEEKEVPVGKNIGADISQTYTSIMSRF